MFNPQTVEDSGDPDQNGNQRLPRTRVCSSSNLGPEETRRRNEGISGAFSRKVVSGRPAK
jgi:hypothetical protein